MTSPQTVTEDSELNHAERAFLDAVLFCHGVRQPPSEAEFRQALSVMSAYAQQVQEHPTSDSGSRIIRRWLSGVSDLDRIGIAAAAFVKFGVTKPNIFQVRAVHRELFGIDLHGDEGLMRP